MSYSIGLSLSEAAITGSKDEMANLSPTDKGGNDSQISSHLVCKSIFDLDISPLQLFEDTTEVGGVTKISFKSESDIRKVGNLFNSFSKILNDRKNKCLQFATESVKSFKIKTARCENDPFLSMRPPRVRSSHNVGSSANKASSISVPVEAIKHFLSTIGTKYGEKELQLNKSSRICVTKLRELKHYEMENAAKTRELEKLRSELNKQHLSLQRKKEAVEQEMNQIETKIVKCTKELDDVTEQAIKLRFYGKSPTRMTINVVKVCALLVEMVDEDKLGQEYKKWEKTRDKLMTLKLIEKMRNYKFVNSKIDICNKIESKWIHSANKPLSVEKVKQDNRLAAKMLAWALAQIEYSKKMEELGPRALDLEAFEVIIENNEKKLGQAKEMSKEIAKTMKNCDKEVNDLIEKINILMDELESMEIKKR